MDCGYEKTGHLVKYLNAGIPYSSVVQAVTELTEKKGGERGIKLLKKFSVSHGKDLPQHKYRDVINECYRQLAA